MPPRVDEDTKTELARVARSLLKKGGLQALSMRAVAKKCGLTAAAIYRHYEDKDALVAAAVVEGFRIFGSYLMDALECDTPEERFRMLGRRYFDFARENPQDYRLIFMTDCKQLGMRHLDEISKREISGTFQLLQDRVSECQAAGIFHAGDARALAASVWSSTHGLSSLFITGNLGETAEEANALIELHLDQIVRGLRS
jgi:AcrR family transcriptional regulator